MIDAYFDKKMTSVFFEKVLNVNKYFEIKNSASKKKNKLLNYCRYHNKKLLNQLIRYVYEKTTIVEHTIRNRTSVTA